MFSLRVYLPSLSLFIILVFYKTHRLEGVTSFFLQLYTFYVVINKLLVVKQRHFPGIALPFQISLPAKIIA